MATILEERRGGYQDNSSQRSTQPSLAATAIHNVDRACPKDEFGLQPPASPSEGSPHNDEPICMGLEPWAECSEVVRGHHEAMVRRWKEEIDTLLVYGGLFSAVLTAFNVELYSALQPSPTDTTNALLAQMAAQLNSFALSPSFANASQPFVPLPSFSSFRAATTSVWINALWFSSLTCSLSSACIGMMVKQWLHETELGLPGTSREAFRLRQYRLDALVKWRVGMIVALLPILLLLASALFLAGLLTLLWTLHQGVAAMASVLVGALLAFTLVTVFLPAFSNDCAYRSPQALVVFLLVQAACRFSRHLLRPVRQIVYLRSSHSKAWSHISRFLEAATLAKWGNYRSWSGLERVVIQESQHVLDQHTVETANALLLDDAFTIRVLRPCIQSLPAHHAYRSFQQVHRDRVRHTGGHYDGQLSVDTAVTLALDVAELYLDGAEGNTSCNPHDLDNLAADMRALPHNMVSSAVSERLYKTLVKILTRGNAGSKCASDVHSMLDCMTSTKWVLGELSEITCGEAARDVITVLEGLRDCPTRLGEYDPSHSGHRELVAFLSACYLRPGFAPTQDYDFVRAHLYAALVALEAYMTKPGWNNEWGSWLLVNDLAPVLEELYAQLPGSVTPRLVTAMESAAEQVSSQSKVDGSGAEMGESKFAPMGEAAAHLRQVREGAL